MQDVYQQLYNEIASYLTADARLEARELIAQMDYKTAVATYYSSVRKNELIRTAIAISKLPKRNPMSERRAQYFKSAMKKHFADMPEGPRNSYVWSMAQSDPTDTGEYATWIFKLFKNGLIRFPEDKDKLTEELAIFHARKQFWPVPDRDINKLKTFGELRRLINKNEGMLSQKEKMELAIREGIELLEEKSLPDKNIKLYKATTVEAASELARGPDRARGWSGWCVKDPDHAAHYLESGPLFFFFLNDQPYALLHAETNQAMTVDDEPVDKEQEEFIREMVAKHIPSLICSDHKYISNNECPHHPCSRNDLCRFCIKACDNGDCQCEMCINCEINCKLCSDVLCSCCIYDCESCGNTVCQNCFTVFRYGRREKRYCKECSTACDNCYESIPNDDFLDVRIETCEECSKNYCTNCDLVSYCNECERHLCMNHMENCLSCNEIVCNDCSVNCPSCRKDVCKTCVSRCSKCSNYVCGECYDQREDVCINCNSEEE